MILNPCTSQINTWRSLARRLEGFTCIQNFPSSFLGKSYHNITQRVFPDNKYKILCFFDGASLYNLVIISKLFPGLFLVYLFLVYLLISTCLERLCVHHQELKSIIQWLLRVVFCAVVFSSSWSGVELRVMCLVCMMLLLAQHVSGTTMPIIRS